MDRSIHPPLKSSQLYFTTIITTILTTISDRKGEKKEAKNKGNL